MSEPVSFDSVTPRLKLPHLFPAQAQKEFFINESLARLDVMVHPAIEEEISQPPASTTEGQCWLVADNPSGDWTGEAGKIASWQNGAWIFCDPVPGMRVTDIATGGSLFYHGSWTRLAAPAPPTSGPNVDEEARQAIVSIIATLRDAGLFPEI